MNGRDTVTLSVGGEPRRVRFLGAGAVADLPPLTGAFEMTAPGERGDASEVRVAMEGLGFLWSADSALDAEDVAERIMRTVGLLCVEAHLSGDLEPDSDGRLQVRDFIGDRYPDYTSAERFIGTLYDSPGKTERWVREDVLRCLAAHADEKATDEHPTGPGLTVQGFLAWPAKRRFYSAESVRDALLAWESEGLVARDDDHYRLKRDRLDDARALLS